MSEKTRINQMLMSRGLGKLNDPGLVPQLGFLMGLAIKDHEAFRDLLNKCKPAERRNMYEAMRSYLSFECKPLDVYVAELGQIAEAKQMPVIAEDGTLKPFNVIDISTGRPVESPKDAPVDYDDDLMAPHLKELAARKAANEADEKALAQSLIEEAAAVEWLTVVCGACTRSGQFYGWNKDAAIAKARTAGWRYRHNAKAECCPSCSK